MNKTLRIFGPRRWTLSGRPTPAEPFESLRIDWAHAFGGSAIAEGALPNVMRPGEQLRSPQQRSRPAGLCARPPGAPERLRYAGSYDNDWREQLAPDPPADFDARFYFTAPSDQWLTAPLRGDEAFVVENMHPDKPRLDVSLPALAVRCLAGQRGSAGILHEVPMRLDTVRLFPHRELGILTFRGLLQVIEDDADDVSMLLIACETVSSPRARAHYEQALQRRQDREAGVIAALDDSDLLPDGVTPPRPPNAATAPSPSILSKRLDQRAHLELATARQQLLDAGIDADAHGLPRDLPSTDGTAGSQEIWSCQETLRHQLEAERQQADQIARAQCAAQGMDFDAMLAQGQEQAARPPTFSAADTLATYEAQLQLARNAGATLPRDSWHDNSAQWRAHLHAVEQQLHETYLRYAHLGPRPVPRPNERERGRQILAEALARAEPIAGQDLTCADLSGLDLTGADLRGAWLAGADLRGCNLDNARLDDAVLAFADLTEARLQRAHLHNTNLGGATLCRADMTACTLDGAVLSRADLTLTCLRDAQLDRVELDGSILAGADLRAAQLSNVRANQAVWLAADLRQARVQLGLFLGFAAPQSDLSDARFERCCFIDMDLKGANMQRVLLQRCAFVGQVALAEADLRHATLEHVSLAGADMARTQLREAILHQVDFSATILTGASFYRARAVNVLWRRARLQDAVLVSLDAQHGIFQRAELAGADLSGANLYGTDFTGARTDERTRFTDAMTARAQLPARRHREAS